MSCNFQKATFDDIMTDQTIIGIEEQDGKKFVHFYGYGYYADGNPEKEYRFLEYTGFYVPLSEVLARGPIRVEEEYQENYKQYIKDCDREELDEIYLNYDNGQPPLLIESWLDMTEDMPCGIYMLK